MTPSSRSAPATEASPGRPADVPRASRTPAAAAIATRKPASGPARCRRADEQRAEHAERDDPATGRLQRAGEIRRDGEDDRHALGDEARRGTQASRSRPGAPIPKDGPAADCEPCRGDRDRATPPRMLPTASSDDRAPSGRDGGDHEHDRPQPEQVVEESPHGIEPAGTLRQERRQRALEGGRRVRDDEERQPEEGRHEHQDVGRTPEPRLRDGGGEDANAGSGSLHHARSRRHATSSRKRW